MVHSIRNIRKITEHLQNPSIPIDYVIYYVDYRPIMYSYRLCIVYGLLKIIEPICKYLEKIIRKGLFSC